MKALLVVFCILGSVSYGQKSVFLTIKPKISGADLVIGNTYTDHSGVDFNLDHFDYYLSGLHVYHDGGQDLDLTDTVYLVEPENNLLFLGYLNVEIIDSIFFGIGVPASLNTINGANTIDISTYPENHPLSFQDPSMHWGWTAGYMHMIIGGSADSNSDGAPDAYFELHTIGDQNYSYVALPIIQTNTSSQQIDIYLDCNIENWLKEIPIETVGGLHGSNGFNQEVMQNVEDEDVFTQPLSASVEKLDKQIGSCSFSLDGTTVVVNWKNLIEVDHFSLTTMNGQRINFGIIENSTGNLRLDVLPKGIYTMSFYNVDNAILNSVKISN